MNKVFKAIADPTRRSILLKVAEQPIHINSIAESFNMSRPAISKHIRILEESELIKIETDPIDGRQRNCYAQLEALAEVSNYLLQLQQFWEDRLDHLGKYLNENKSL